jgi:hypothetical protein
VRSGTIPARGRRIKTDTRDALKLAGYTDIDAARTTAERLAEERG